LERRLALLQKTESSRKELDHAAKEIKRIVSEKVDALSKDLHNVGLETKQKTVRQKLRHLFSNTRNKSQQKAKQK
jgi:hypothetical protein